MKELPDFQTEVEEYMPPPSPVLVVRYEIEGTRIKVLKECNVHQQELRFYS